MKDNFLNIYSGLPYWYPIRSEFITRRIYFIADAKASSQIRSWVDENTAIEQFTS